MNRESEDRLLAKLFGISNCCVDLYCQYTLNVYKAPILDGGVRLCSSCAKIPTHILIRRINEKRICPTAYPTNPKTVDLNKILEDKRFTQEERDWLRDNQFRFLDYK